MGEAIEITRMDRSAAELRALAVKTEDSDVVRRLLGIALLLDGWPRGEAATASGMDRQTLCDWVHRYNAAGVAGLATGTRCGRPPALNEAQMAELKEWVIKALIRRRTALCVGAALICRRRSLSSSRSPSTSAAWPSCCASST